MKKFVILSLVFWSIASHAEVKPYMDQMLGEIFEIKPYIVSEAAFKEPKNADKISLSLKKMAEISEKINHEDKIKKTGFKVSGKVLTQQLRETDMVFISGRKDYALWMLKTTLGTCMSCHTQLPSGSTPFSTLNSTRVLTNPFEEAEFLFVVKNFNEAMKLYESALSGYPKNQVSIDSLEKIVYRQLFYYVRAQRDFNGLISTLQKDMENKKLPKGLLKKIENLKIAAESMKNEPYPSFTVKQQKELRKYIESTLKDELRGEFSLDHPHKELTALKVSSVLYEHMNQYPDTPLKPDILYWLALCESHYSRQAFHSLPELYLKQCVQEHPKSPVAKKCLKEYKELMTMAYTGSSGTHLPPEVTKEIQNLEERIGKKK